MIRILLLLACLAAIYWFWIRPILRSRPEFKRLWDAEDNLFTALQAKFAGIKGKLTTAITSGAGIAVAVHDYVAPIAATVDTSPIATQVKPTTWLAIIIAVPLLLQFFRWLADRRRENANE